MQRRSVKATRKKLLRTVTGMGLAGMAFTVNMSDAGPSADVLRNPELEALQFRAGRHAHAAEIERLARLRVAAPIEDDAGKRVVGSCGVAVAIANDLRQPCELRAVNEDCVSGAEGLVVETDDCGRPLGVEVQRVF